MPKQISILFFLLIFTGILYAQQTQQDSHLTENRSFAGSIGRF